MSKIEFIQDIGKIIVFLLVLLSIFLFTVNGNRRLPNRLFALFLLVTAFDFTGLFMTNTIMNNPNALIIKTSSSLLQMPIFYLYVLSVCYIDFRLKRKHLAHTFLFFFFVALFKITETSERSLLFFEILGELQYVLYMIAIFIVLKKYRSVYLQNFSNASSAAYRWLFQITVIFCIAHSFVLFKWIVSYYREEPYLLNINVLISVTALLIICWIVLKALYRPQLFTGISIDFKPIKPLNIKNITAAKEDLVVVKQIEMLRNYMEKEKPYLDFNLSLQKLSSAVNIPEKELSVLINQSMNSHFFDFVNEFRIEEAKKILTNPERKHLTILEILYEVGFNSKSSFYTAFKKITNQTPIQFRRKMLSNKN